MLLTVQHVAPATPDRGAPDFNAYRYKHSLDPWSIADLDALRRTQRLVARDERITPGGNRVRSYLDLYAPDDARQEQLRLWLRELLSQASWEEFPVRCVHGDWLLEFSVDRPLAAAWRSELQDLVSRMLLLLD